jgi:hypothetical protein
MFAKIQREHQNVDLHFVIHCPDGDTMEFEAKALNDNNNHNNNNNNH